MKSNLKLLAAVLSVSLIGGCAAKSGGESSQNNSSTTTASAPTVSSTPSSEAPESTEPDEPKGEPTFLIGLDGKAIYTGEITRLENTDKTAETLTEDDLYAEIYCEGFAYVKEPAAPYYNNYKNPELFKDWEFLGGETTNTNPWKRVNVGDEICGFKVKAAQTRFETNDWGYNFPAKYYTSSNNLVELEGTAELEGFLQITAEAKLYPGTGGKLSFYPCESKLPAMPGYNIEDANVGYETDFSTKVVFDHTQIQFQSELESFYLGQYDETDCDLDGLGKGDVAYARVTLDDIRLFGGGGGTATVQKVELLSDILDHNDDNE